MVQIYQHLMTFTYRVPFFSFLSEAISGGQAETTHTIRRSYKKNKLDLFSRYVLASLEPRMYCHYNHELQTRLSEK